MRTFSELFTKFLGIVISRRFYFANKNISARKINFSLEITLLSGKLFQIHMCLLDLIKNSTIFTNWFYVTLRACSPLLLYF